jgi:beta-galactosidase
MKKYSIQFITVLTVFWFGCENKQQFEWEDPTVFQINQEPPRAHFFPYESEALAQLNDHDRSQYFQSLNGNWKFNFSPNPDDRPKTSINPIMMI